jgi:hypothetical protein
MAAKQSIKIAELVAEVNRLNRESTVEPKMREGWNSLLEWTLQKANAYSGYGWLTQSQVPAGQLAGIIVERTPDGELVPDGKTEWPDDSRRIYYQKVY